MTSLHRVTGSLMAGTRRRRLDYLTVLVFGIFVVLAIHYQIKLLNYIEWGDEAETIVAAKMIAAGGTLYSQIFNHHGPLTFLPGVFLEKLGDFGITGHRIPIAILQIVALFSIYFSPLLKNRFTGMLYVIAAASVLLLYSPEIFGHTYMYQVMAGLFLVVILVQYTLPAIACPELLASKNIVIGNVLIASLPFLAITFVPVSALLFFASLRKQFLKRCLLSSALGFVANIAWLMSIGSISGFLAFHIYLNAKILPNYNDGQSGSQLIVNAFNSVTGDLNQFVIFTVFLSAISRLASVEKSIPWRSFLLILGVWSLLIRGAGFQGLPYFYSLLAIPIIFFYDRSITARQSQIVALVFAIVCICKISLMMPGDDKKLESRKIPESTEFAQLVQFFTNKGDRIIAYSFENYQYIAADRLPASGNFFYLPWQEKYNESPKFGIQINSCKDIAAYRPKVMLIDKWKVWDKFPWDSYATCIQSLMDKDYIQVSGKPYYIRKDLIADDKWLKLGDSSTTTRPSAQLSATSPIRLFMASGHQEQTASLKRIGVMFGTYVMQNEGSAELRLKGPDGSEFIQRFALPDLADNKYRYFDLDSKGYTTGEIVSISGGGVSTWESHNEKGGTHTCITYEYADGKRQFTPSCPLF